MGLPLDYVGLAVEGYFITGLEFFLPPALDHAIHQNFTSLDDQLSLSPRTDQAL